MDSDTYALLGILDIIADWKACKIRIEEQAAEINTLKQRQSGNVIVLDKAPVETPNG